MNRSLYRKIFSQRLGAVVAVAETAMSGGKRPGQSRRAARAAVALAALGLAGTAAFGQVTFPSPGDITGMTGWTATPGDGNTWILGTAGAYSQPSVVTLPSAGARTFNLQGNGNTLSLATSATSGSFAGLVNGGTYTLNLSDIALTQGSATGSPPANFGGAITTQNNNTRSLTINATGVVGLTNNHASGNGNGGAIYAGGPVTIAVDQAFTLSGNTAGGSGGAINTFTGGGVSITGDSDSAITLDSNTAASVGGAIFVTNPNNANTGVTIDAGNISITGNTSSNSLGGAISTLYGINIGSAANDSVVTISGNKAGTGGGALYGAGVNPGTKIVIDGSQITIRGNQATGAGGNGGAIYMPANDDSTLTIGNAASQVIISDNSAQFGGALTVTTTVIHGSDIEITGNQGTTRAGGIYSSNAYPITIGDAASTIAISNNTGGTGSTSGGGGVYATGALTLGGANSALTVTGNSAQFGGAVIAASNTPSTSTATINGGGTFSGNTAPGGSGGAIYVNGALTLNASSTAQGLTFSGNTPDAIMLDNTAVANAVAFNATASNIVFEDPIDSSASNLSAVTTTGPKAVIFDGADSASYIYAATTVQSGVFAVQNGASYGALVADFNTRAAIPLATQFSATSVDVTIDDGVDTPDILSDTTYTPVASAVPAATGFTSFTVASNATLAGGGAGTVRADSFTLGRGTLDISGSGITPDNAAVGLPPGNAAANGMSAFSIIASNDGPGAGVNLSGGTVKFNVCGNKQQADVLDLTTAPAVTPPITITGGATPVFTQVAGCTGAPTTGNGILIVQSNSPNADLFAASRTTRDIGGIAYTLNYVANTTGNTYNWYLQSTGGIFIPPPAAPIPTLGQTALALLALLLGGGAALARRRRWR